MSANLNINTTLDDEQELQHLLAKQVGPKPRRQHSYLPQLPLQYSCTECRRRKQRCIPNKAGPCANCARRYPPVECVGRPGDNHASTLASASSRSSSSDGLPSLERNSNCNSPIPLLMRIAPNPETMWDEKEDSDFDSQTSPDRFHRPPIHKQQQRLQSNVPLISMSSNGPYISRHLSQDQTIGPFQIIHSNYSQSSTFSPLNTESRQQNAAMATWTAQFQPLSSYNSWSPKLMHVLEEESESASSFLDRTILVPKIVIPPSISILSPATIDNHRLSTNFFNMQTPSTPTSDSLTTATTLTSSMSRQNSLCNETMSESMEMMRCNAQASSSIDMNDQFYTQIAPHFSSSHHSRRSDGNFCFVPSSSKPENEPEDYSLLPRQDTNKKQVVLSPTPTYPLEKSWSRDTFSSYSDDETEWDEDELSPDPPNLDSFQIALVERIMNQFWKIFNHENNVTSLIRNNTIHYESYYETSPPTDEGDNKSSQDTTVSPTETQNRSQKTPARNERKRSRDFQDNQDDNEDERSSKRRRTLFSPPLKGDDNTKFACPYRKHNPRKYCVRDWRPCALTPLDTVARVKTHLYRHHRIFPCQRCKELFEDQDQVSEHLKEANACELSYTLQADGVTSEMVEKLRGRKRTHKDQTEVEKWQDIYKLLFPNEIVPSPCFDPVQEDTAGSPDFRALDDYEEYCRRELPRHVKAAVEEAVHQGQPVENVIGSQLMNIIRHCQGQVYSRYRSSATPVISPALRNPAESASPTARPPLSWYYIDNSVESISQLGANLEPPLRTYFERPIPHTHPESRLESPTPEYIISKPAGKTSSPDSGYVSNDSSTPVSPLEGLSQAVPELPEANPLSDHSYSTIEEPSLEQELSQNEFSFHGTEPSAQESYDPFGGEWNMGNTDVSSWFGVFAVPDWIDRDVYEMPI